MSNSEDIEEAPRSQDDGIMDILKKTLDPNKYATKKTIAQGLLDVALLTANASQLKYVLQILQGALCIFLGVRIDINDQDDHGKAEQANNVVLLVNFLLLGVNVVINIFDIRSYS